MHILLASDTYYPNVNGASYFTQRLAAMLAQRGHRVSVICPSETFAHTVTVRDGVTMYGLRSITTPIYKGFRISPLVVRGDRIRHIIEELRPDVIHVQNHFIIGRGVLAAAQEFNIPIMGTNHFMPENLVHFFHLPRPAEEWLKDNGWKQFLRVYQHLDIITSPTQTAADLITGYGLKKEVIPVSCGIDLNRFHSDRDGSRLREQYGIPADRRVLLSVGRLEKEKRVEVTLRAMPMIAEKANAHLVIAGIGKLKQHLKHLTKEFSISERVTFTGFVPDEDMSDLYAMADVFVTAGIAELQSIVTMEAMASGLPVIAVNAVALPELVHDGENGYVFTDGDSTTLANRAVTLLTDSGVYKTMSAASLQIIQKHDIQKTIDTYEALYRKTIEVHANARRAVNEDEHAVSAES